MIPVSFKLPRPKRCPACGVPFIPQSVLRRFCYRLVCLRERNNRSTKKSQLSKGE